MRLLNIQRATSFDERNIYLKWNECEDQICVVQQLYKRHVQVVIERTYTAHRVQDSTTRMCSLAWQRPQRQRRRHRWRGWQSDHVTQIQHFCFLSISPAVIVCRWFFLVSALYLSIPRLDSMEWVLCVNCERRLERKAIKNKQVYRRRLTHYILFIYHFLLVAAFRMI